MPKIHAVAFSESVDQALGNITPVADDLITTSGDDLTVPPELPLAAFAYFGGASMERARIKTAFLLKERFYPSFLPVDTSTDPGSLPPVHDFSREPLQIIDPNSRTLDKLNVEIENDGAASAVDASALILLTDGPIMPTSIRGALPVRFTGTHTPTAAEAWGTPHSITLDETLAPGVYEIVGVRYQGATTKFWRLVFAEGGYRPGGLAVNGDTEQPCALGQPGAMGVLGRFRSDQLPKFQTLCDSTAAQSPTGLLWLRKVG